MFLGIFGSTRIDRAAYDRGLMCEFYSPTGIVRRQLVSRCYLMSKPRLNIVAAGQPKRIIECLTGFNNNKKGIFRISLFFRSRNQRYN